MRKKATILKQSLSRFIIIILIFAIIFLPITYFILNRIISNNYLTLAEDVLNHTTFELDSYFQQKMDLLDAIEGNEDIQQLLTSSDQRETLYKYLSTYTCSDETIDGLLITTMDDGMIYRNNGDNIQGTSFEPYNIFESDDHLYRFIFDPYIDINTGKQVISLSKKIIADQSHVATVTILIHYPHFVDYMQDMFQNNNAQLILTTQDYNVIFPNQTDTQSQTILMSDYTSFLKSNTASSQRFLKAYSDQTLIGHNTLASDNIHFIISFEKDLFAQIIKEIMILIFISVFILILIISIFLMVYIFGIKKTITSFTHSVDQMLKGDLSPVQIDSRTFELNDLKGKYNQMISGFSRVTQNVSDISKGIHQYASSITELANQSSKESAEISAVMSHMSFYTKDQRDIIQNVLSLSQSINENINHSKVIIEEAKSNNQASKSVVSETHELTTSMIQKCTVLDLSLRNLSDQLGQCLEGGQGDPIPDHLISDVQSSLDDCKMITQKIYDDMSLNHEKNKSTQWSFQSTTTALTDLNHDILQMYSKKTTIAKILESLNKTSEYTNDSVRLIINAVDSQNQAVNDMSHEISNLYQSSLRLSNLISKYIH